MQPQNSSSSARVDFVDALRGFALLGVFGANLLIFSGYIFMTDDQKAHRATTLSHGTDGAHVVSRADLVWHLAVLWIMPGPNLMGKVGPTWLALIWLVGYALQVWLASVWLRHFRIGPAEWIWRSLTYWKRQTLRLGAATAS